MPTIYADEYKKAYVDQPATALKVSQSGGKVRYKMFTLNTTVTPVNSADVILLCKIPAGGRVVGGSVAFGAMGAGATLQIGIAGTTGKYLGSTSVAAAGTAKIADTIALGHGDDVVAETTIQALAGGANYAAAQDLKGEIAYVLD